MGSSGGTAGFPGIWVKAYGAVGDGVTDDTAAIQRAIDAAKAQKKSCVSFGDGTYIAAGLVLPTGVHLWGFGFGGDLFSDTDALLPFRGAVLKLKSGANTDLIITENFAILTGQASPSAYLCPERYGIHNMVLDGNKDQNSAGLPLRMYGRSYVIDNVTIQNGAAGGVYSEWGAGGYQMESQWSNFIITANVGIGLDWHGPHDSQFSNGVVSRNDGYVGIKLGDGYVGGEQFSNVHAWGQHTYQWSIATFNGSFSNCTSDGPGGVQILTSGNQWFGTIYGTNVPGECAVTLGDGTARTITNNQINARVFNLAKGSMAVRFWPDQATQKLNEFKFFISGGGNTRYFGAGKSFTTGSNAFPVATLTVVDASSFPASGTLYISDGTNILTSVTYTGVAGNTLTGCTGGTGTYAAGSAVWSTATTAAGNTYSMLDPDNASSGVWSTPQTNATFQNLSAASFNVFPFTVRPNTSATAMQWIRNETGRVDMAWDNSGSFGKITANSPLSIGGTAGNGYIQFDSEQSSDPAAPAANQGRFFSRDNGGGKTQLCVRFNTGAVQVIATEP